MPIIKPQQNIDNEAMSTFDQKRYFIMPKIKMFIHTKDDDLEIPFVTNIRISRNFNTNITDVIFIEFLTGLGMLTERIYKNRENLEVSIIFDYDKKAMRSLRYKFIVISDNPNRHSSSKKEN